MAETYKYHLYLHSGNLLHIHSSSPMVHQDGESYPEMKTHWIHHMYGIFQQHRYGVIVLVYFTKSISPSLVALQMNTLLTCFYGTLKINCSISNLTNHNSVTMIMLIRTRPMEKIISIYH